MVRITVFNLVLLFTVQLVMSTYVSAGGGDGINELQLHEAVKDLDSLEALKQLLSGMPKGDQLLNSANGQGHTALHVAALLGNGEAVRLLLEHGADVFVKNSYGTPREMVQMLLEGSSKSSKVDESLNERRNAIIVLLKKAEEEKVMPVKEESLHLIVSVEKKPVEECEEDDFVCELDGWEIVS